MPLKGQKMTPRPKGAKQLRVAEALDARMDYLSLTEQEIKDKLESTPKADRPLAYGIWRTFRNGIDTAHTPRTVRAVEDLVIWEHGTIDALMRNKITIQQAAQQGDGMPTLREMEYQTQQARRAAAIAQNRPIVAPEPVTAYQAGEAQGRALQAAAVAKHLTPGAHRPDNLARLPEPFKVQPAQDLLKSLMRCVDALEPLDRASRREVVEALRDRYLY